VGHVALDGAPELTTRWIDTLLQRLVGIWLSFPLIILALGTISIFGGG